MGKWDSLWDSKLFIVLLDTFIVFPVISWQSFTEHKYINGFSEEQFEGPLLFAVFYLNWKMYVRAGRD